jgi:hypothetical protein
MVGDKRLPSIGPSRLSEHAGDGRQTPCRLTSNVRDESVEASHRMLVGARRPMKIPKADPKGVDRCNFLFRFAASRFRKEVPRMECDFQVSVSASLAAYRFSLVIGVATKKPVIDAVI